MKFATILFCLLPATLSTASPVATAEGLVKAVQEAKEGAVVELGKGRFEISAPLELKAGVTLKGAGIGKTFLTNAAAWKGNPATLPDPETNYRKFDKTGYLIHLAGGAGNTTVSDMTLTGPQLHGGIYG